MSPPWQTIRVFISSTFRDTHEERNALTRWIFPELRAWCEERFIHIVEIDLRWGVTQEESASGKAIEICLDEIDRSNIFLCLIGSRYGWVPFKYEIGEDPRFDWINKNPKVQGRSITELEIMRGALNAKDCISPKTSHALFYFRDDSTIMDDLADKPDTLSDLTDGHCVVKSGIKYFERDLTKEVMLQELKNNIRLQINVDNGVRTTIHEKYRPLQNYKIRNDTERPIDESAQEEFCAKVLHDLKCAINEISPTTELRSYQKPQDDEANQECQNSYMEQKLLHFQARDDQIKEILSYIDAERADGPLLLVGEAGIGKTSLLLKSLSIVESRQDWSRENMIIKFIAGSSPGSLMAINMLKSLIVQLRTRINASKSRRRVDHLWSMLRTSVKVGAAIGFSYRTKKSHENHLVANNEVSGSFQELIDYFHRLLISACSITKVVLAIDNIEHMLKDSSHVIALQWLPKKIPDSLRLILVANEESEDKLALKEHGMQDRGPASRPASPLETVKDVDLSKFSENMVCSLGNSPVQEKEEANSDLQNNALIIPNFKTRFPGYIELHLYGLSRIESEKLTCALLGTYGKKLDKSQMSKLLMNPSAYNPTWIVIACEELRIFNLYEQVTSRILEMPTDVPSLLSQFLDRIERDHGCEFVRDTLSAIVCSRDGLFENEILDIFNVSHSTWTRLFYAIKPFLRRGRLNEEELIAFAHRDITVSIVVRYFSVSPLMQIEVHDPASRIHKKLARYYKRIAFDNGRKKWNHKRGRALWSLPYHQMQGKLFKELEMTLTDLSFVEAACKAGGGFDWVSDLSRALLEYEKQDSLCYLGSPNNFSDSSNMHFRSDSPKSSQGLIDTLDEEVSEWIDTQEHNKKNASINNFSGHSRLPNASSRLLGHMKYTKMKVNKIKDYQEFAQAHIHSLMRFPHLVFQYAINMPHSNIISKEAEGLWHRVCSGTCVSNAPYTWLRLLNKLNEPSPCIMELRGHTASILSCNLSFCGEKCVSGAVDGTIRIWSVQSGETIARLEGHTGAVNEVIFSPKNQDLILSVSADGTARIWNKTVQSYIFKKHNAPVNCCTISKDGQVVATGDAVGKIIVWSMHSLQIVGELMGLFGAVIKCAFSNDLKETSLYAIRSDNTIRAYNLNDLSQNFVKSGNGLCISSTMRGAESDVQIMLKTKSMKLKVFETNPKISSNGNLESHDPFMGITLQNTGAHLVTCGAFSPAFRVACGYVDGKIEIYNTKNGHHVCSLFGHISKINYIAYNLNGKKLFTASDDCTIRIWDPYKARMSNPNLHKSRVVKSCFHVALHAIEVFSLSVKGEIQVWDSRSCRSRSLSSPVGREKISDIRIISSGTQIVTVDSRLTIWSYDKVQHKLSSPRTIAHDNIKLWDLSPCEKIAVIIEYGATVVSFWNLNNIPFSIVSTVETSHMKDITICKFSRDGSLMFTTGLDGIVNVWDVVEICGSTGLHQSKKVYRPVAILRDPGDSGLSMHYNRLYESPDGTTLITTAETPTIKHWNLHSSYSDRKNKDQVVINLYGHTSRITGISWALHSQLFGSCAVDGTIKIWDAQTLLCILTIAAHSAAISDFMFLPDGIRLVSVSVDASCFIWSVKSGEQLNAMLFSSSISSLNVDPTGRYLAVGDSKGQFKIMEIMMNLSHSPQLSQYEDNVHELQDSSTEILFKELDIGRNSTPFVIPIRYVFLTVRGPKKWAEKPKVRCPYCNTLFSINGKLLQALMEEEKLRNSKGVSRLVLSAKQFVTRCEECKSALRLTPFKLDRKDLKYCAWFDSSTLVGNSVAEMCDDGRSGPKFERILDFAEPPGSSDDVKITTDVKEPPQSDHSESVLGLHTVRKFGYRVESGSSKEEAVSFYSQIRDFTPFRSCSENSLPSLKETLKLFAKKSNELYSIRSPLNGSGFRVITQVPSSTKCKSRNQQVLNIGRFQIEGNSSKDDFELSNFINKRRKEKNTRFRNAKSRIKNEKQRTNSPFPTSESTIKSMIDSDLPLGESCEIVENNLDCLRDNSSCKTAHLPKGTCNKSAHYTADLSAINSTSHVRSLVVEPESADLDLLCVNKVYTFSICLLNTSGSNVRIRTTLDHTDEVNVMSILHNSACNPLVTGLKSEIFVQLNAKQTGELLNGMHIYSSSGAHIFVPISGKIVSESEYEILMYKREDCKQVGLQTERCGKLRLKMPKR